MTDPRHVRKPCLEIANRTTASDVDALSPTKAPTLRQAFSVVSWLTDTEAMAGAHDVDLQASWAFVAGKGGSLAIVDVSNPAAPILAWRQHDQTVLEDCETVLPLGHHLLVGARDLLSFDITDPSAPILRTVLSDRPRIDRINGMVRRGALVLAANKRGWLDCFDITDPAVPRFIGALDTGSLYGLRAPHDIDVFDDYAVVVEPAGFGRYDQPGKLAIFRIADDTTHEPLPVEQWTLVQVVESPDLTGANRVQVVGQHAFVGVSLVPEAHTNGRTGRGVVVDLFDPAQARQVATHTFSDSGGPNGLTVAGRVWFLAGGRTVEALDVSDPNQPRALAAFHLGDELPAPPDDAHDVVCCRGHLYITRQHGHSLVVLKINDPILRDLVGQPVVTDTAGR